MTDPKHPGPARDVNLNDWLDGVGFHPADTELKQRGHEAARLLTALYATHLHQLLPPGRIKSLVFTKLEEVLQRSNQALAVGKGPHGLVSLEALQELVDALKGTLADLEAVVPYDPRISQYEAEQRGERFNGLPVPPERPVPGQPEPAIDPLAPFECEHRSFDGLANHIEAAVTTNGQGVPVLNLGVSRGGSAAGVSAAEVNIEDPEVVEGFASFMLAAANQLRLLQGR